MTACIKPIVNRLNGRGESFEASDFCEIITPTSAEVLAEYEQDFYKGTPAFTLNHYKEGKAYYMTARMETKCLDTFYFKLAKEHSLSNLLGAELPEGVSLQTRTDGESSYVFLMNFTETTQTVHLSDSSEVSM